MDSIDELTGFIGMQELQLITTTPLSNESVFLKPISTSSEMLYNRIVSNIGKLMDAIQSINDIVYANSQSDRKLWYRVYVVQNLICFPVFLEMEIKRFQYTLIMQI